MELLMVCLSRRQRRRASDAPSDRPTEQAGPFPRTRAAENDDNGSGSSGGSIDLVLSFRENLPTTAQAEKQENNRSQKLSKELDLTSPQWGANGGFELKKYCVSPVASGESVSDTSKCKI